MPTSWNSASGTRIDYDWLTTPSYGAMPATEAAIAEARAFVFAKWTERAAERRLPAPADLTDACKFSSLFVKLTFGGAIDGNYDHQFNRIDGRVVDLNADAMDVRRLGPRAHLTDDEFLYEDDFHASMESCLPRVEGWASEFASLHPSASPGP